MVKKNVRGGKSGVAAKIHFHRWRHPAQIEVVSSRNDEGRLGQIIFGRERLQLRVWQPLLQKANAGGITAERSIGEGRNFVIGNFHLGRQAAREAINIT